LKSPYLAATLFAAVVLWGGVGKKSKELNLDVRNIFAGSHSGDALGKALHHKKKKKKKLLGGCILLFLLYLLLQSRALNSYKLNLVTLRESYPFWYFQTKLVD
jgi:hypothetical protein